jgi:hypothetical protein
LKIKIIGWFQSSVILVGGQGYESNGRLLHQLSSPNENWTEMKQKLKERRYWHVALMIPDDIVNCH